MERRASRPSDRATTEMGSRAVPGVNDVKTTILEVFDIARGELGPSHLGNCRDLRIRMADRSAEGTALSRNLGKNSRCVALEPKNAPRQVLREHSFRRHQQPFAALALGQQLNSIKDFRPTTREEGLGLISSESTLVSRMVIRQIPGPGG